MTVVVVRLYVVVYATTFGPHQAKPQPAKDDVQSFTRHDASKEPQKYLLDCDCEVSAVSVNGLSSIPAKWQLRAVGDGAESSSTDDQNDEQIRTFFCVMLVGQRIISLCVVRMPRARLHMLAWLESPSKPEAARERVLAAAALQIRFPMSAQACRHLETYSEGEGPITPQPLLARSTVAMK